MNSKLVTSTCDKVGGWLAYGQNEKTAEYSDVLRIAKGLCCRVELLLIVFFIAFLTTPTTAQTSCQLTCDDQKNISIGTEGYSTIFPELVINGDFSCAMPVTVEVQDAFGAPIGTRIDCDHVGETLTVKVTGANNENCWSSIKVEDKLATGIRCEDVFIPCTASIDPEKLGYPQLHDNCGSTSIGDLHFFDLYTDLPCGTVIEGREVTASITRNWTIADQYNNVGFCKQNIYLLKGYINNIVFPGNCDGITNDPLSCSNDPDDLTFSGAPTINGLPVENADFCKFFVSYIDQKADICPPSSYRLLRRWEVIDLCTKETRVHLQDIVVVDNQGPDLTCPDPVSVDANEIDCSAAIILPQAYAFDSCSNVTITPTWEFGIGYGPYTSVPSGTHLVTYTAADECGNSTSCTSELTVVDNTKPVAVCRDQVHIALSTGGISTVAATIFDGGSQDNCTIARIEAKKDTAFSEYLTFTCTDIEEIQIVTLKVTDGNGHYTICSSQLIIDDEIFPTITCPPTATIKCTDLYEDLLLTGGEATAEDDCYIKSIYYTDELNFNNCGTSGTILRNWFAEDPAGNLSSCTQLINVLDQTPLQINFPKEYNTFHCGSDLSPATTGTPIISGQDCEDVLVSHTDERIELGGNTCYQLLRTWKVIDWCELNEVDNNGNGLYTFTQVINVQDWDSPEITFCPEDITVDINNFECEVPVQLPSIIANDCNAFLNYTNDSPYATVNNQDASGNYPQGTTTVTITASDGCGNASSCIVDITVLDIQAPTPVCKHSIAIALRPDGTVLVPPNAINSGSYDNCESNTDLTYEIAPNYFTCADVGQQTINLIVTDASGNSDFCTTEIFIQDNHDNCDPTGFSAIGGKITTESGAAMEAVAVAITGGMSEMQPTNIAGEYLFENLSKTESYTVQPMTGAQSKEGVSTFDIVLIQKHILDVESLDSPYKLIAADVNNSGSITTFDVVQLRRLILGVIEEFPNNTSWRYVATDYEFPDAENPFANDFPEHINYDQLFGKDLERNFIAIKVGDVNNSASPDAMVATSRNTLPPLQLQVTDIDLQAYETYKIPVSTTQLNHILGYQFGLQFNTDFIEIQEVIPNKTVSVNLDNFGLHHLDRGLLTTSWDQSTTTVLRENNTLFTLVLQVKSNTKLSEVLHLDEDLLSSEAYSQQKELLPIQLNFDTEMAKLFQNQPNPFQQTTTIGCSLPQATHGSLSILDINGRLLKRYEQYFQKGYNEVQIDVEDLATQGGVLYYQLETPITPRLSKKMIVLH